MDSRKNPGSSVLLVDDTTPGVQPGNPGLSRGVLPATPGGLGQSTAIGLSIVSDSRLLREGLMVLLSMHIDVHLVGSYGGDPSQGYSLPQVPDQVALVDSGIGRDSAISWTIQWRSLEVPAYVVVLELDNKPDTILDCIEAGANGYVLQGASASEVADTIRLVHDGKATCSPEMTAQLFSRLAVLSSRITNGSGHTIPLTPRELEVLSLVAKGYSDKEIASELVIQVRTVKHHIHNILGKLNLRRRWHAARLASEKGWLNGVAQSQPLKDPWSQ